MFHRRSSVKGSLSFSNPAVRAWLFQILAILAVVAVTIYLIHNTINNLSSRGITSGFAFLDRSAGFGIVQHLIDYQQGDTYGRVFWSVYSIRCWFPRCVLSSRHFSASFSGWRAFQITGYCANSQRFILRPFVISRRCCKSFSGTSRFCAIYPAHVRLPVRWIWSF